MLPSPRLKRRFEGGQHERTSYQGGHWQGAVVAAQHHARLLVLQHQRVVGGRQLRGACRRLKAPLLDVLVQDVGLHRFKIAQIQVGS